jgi:hypothetical protein
LEVGPDGVERRRPVEHVAGGGYRVNPATVLAQLA